MTQIQNFYIQKSCDFFQESYPALNLSRLKWLSRPINLLLRKLGAYEVKYRETSRRISIDCTKVREKIHTILSTQRKMGYKDAATIVLGYDEYHELITDGDPGFCSQLIIRSNPMLMGMDLVLDPSINGIVLLPFRAND